MLDYRTNTFLTVCKKKSYTKAAEALHITQPAVSQHIRYLEKFYGVQLFSFSGKQLALTEAGKLLYQSLSTFHNNELYLKEQLEMITEKRESLHFGATLTVGEFMIANPLKDYLSNHPNADISVTVANTKELLQKLDNGEISFAILEGDYPKHLYEHTPYVTENFIPVCGSGYTFSNAPHKLSDLLDEPLILRESGSGTRMILEDLLSRNNLPLEDFHNIITIGNMNAIKELVMAGCGITFLYETAVREELKKGTICKIPLKELNIQHEISIVWKKDNIFDDSFQALFEELFKK